MSETKPTMTREEFVYRYWVNGTGDEPKELFIADLDALLAAERERCAKAVDAFGGNFIRLSGAALAVSRCGVLLRSLR